jgi:superfamily II DNA or RNA helicase
MPTTAIEKVQFRPYQIDLVDELMNIVMPKPPALAKDDNVAAIVATGGGKTILSVDLITRMLKIGNPAKDASIDPYAWTHDTDGRQILFVVDQINLIKQTAQKFRKVVRSMIYHDGRDDLRGLEKGITFIQGKRSYEFGKSVVIASRQTLSKCYKDMIDQGELRPLTIIFDECHSTAHCATGQEIITYQTPIGGGKFSVPYLARVGLTATPDLPKKKENFKDEWTSVVVGPSHADLIQMGALCPFRYYQYAGEEATAGLKTKGKYGGFVEEEAALRFNSVHRIDFALEQWEAVTGGTEKSICFPVNIAHGEAIVERAALRGHNFRLITYKTDEKLRDQIVTAFDNDLTIKGDSKPPVTLVAVDALKKGFDSLIVQCILDMAPTMSVASHIQKYGRGARNGTPFCRIFDFVGNIPRIEKLYQKGYPDLIVHTPDTVLGIKPYKMGSGGDAPVKYCPECDKPNPAGVAICIHPKCDHHFAFAPTPAETALTGTMYEVTREGDVDNGAKAILFYRSSRIKSHALRHNPLEAWHKVRAYENFKEGAEFAPPAYIKCTQEEKDRHREWVSGCLTGDPTNLEFAYELKKIFLEERDPAKFPPYTINMLLWQEFSDEVFEKVKINAATEDEKKDAAVIATRSIRELMNRKKANEQIAS